MGSFRVKCLYLFLCVIQNRFSYFFELSNPNSVLLLPPTKGAVCTSKFSMRSQNQSNEDYRISQKVITSLKILLLPYKMKHE